MLKLLEQYDCDGRDVELFQTSHSGPDYHVRYGLEVTAYETLDRARDGFDGCVQHARALSGKE